MTHATAQEQRALKRLGARGMVALPMHDQTAAYGVYPRGDRRRRPVARLSSESVTRLLSSGALANVDGESAIVLSEAGRSMLRRSAAAGPDSFRRQHMEIEPAETERGGASRPAPDVNRTESPLAWLARRSSAGGEPFLSPRELAAGERLRVDYHRGRYLGRVTSDWTAPPRSRAARGPRESQLDPGEAVVAARARVDAALRHVGPGLEDVLSAVCLEGRGLNDVERAFGWPSRSGKIVLRIALSRLADHYGLPVDRTSPA